MGSINYGSSEYIFIGVNLSNPMYEDFNEVETLYDVLSLELNKQSFSYFDVTLKPGYYEGFYLNIKSNFPAYFYNYQEKQDAQKEVTQLKKFLNLCVDNGLVQYFPSWCTGYATMKDTRKAIDLAVEKMRDDIRASGTLRGCAV